MPEGESHPQPADRRHSERFETHRTARFSNYRSTGPLRNGRITDMSPSGLRIETANPESIGAEIELEIQPDGALTSLAALLLTGRIAYVEALENERYALGVECRFGPEPAESIRIVASPASAEPEPVAGIPAGRAAAPPVVYRTLESGTFRKRKRTYEWLFAAALVAFIVGLFVSHGLLTRPVSQAAPRAWSQFAAIEEPAAAPPDPITPEDHIGERAEIRGEVPSPDRLHARVESPGLEILLSSAQAALSHGQIEEAMRGLEELAQSPGAQGPEKFIARYQHALTAARRGERGLALKLLRDALDEPGSADAVWTEGAAAELARLGSDYSYVPAATPMDTRLALSSEAAGGPYLTGKGIEIEVDASAYVLRVRRDGRILRAFPVGLGRDGATPIGRFTVTDKIADPDWYDRGRTVPTGSPENPLGKSWMGLARNGEGTGVGIHPTERGDSIGQPMSRGCVRMRPEDAEALFRLAPAGTPVVIHL